MQETNQLYKATLLDGVKEASIIRFREIYAEAFDGEKVLWPYSKDKQGYGKYKVSLQDGSRKSFLAHRLAWLIFKGDIPEGMVVCHKDDNPTNIFVENLFIGTTMDNARDCKNKGRYSNKCAVQGSKNLVAFRHRSSEMRRHFSEEEVKSIRQRYADGATAYSLAQEYGICWTAMSRICKRITYQHVV